MNRRNIVDRRKQSRERNRDRRGVRTSRLPLYLSIFALVTSSFSLTISLYRNPAVANVAQIQSHSHQESLEVPTAEIIPLVQASKLVAKTEAPKRQAAKVKNARNAQKVIKVTFDEPQTREPASVPPQNPVIRTTNDLYEKEDLL